MLRKLSSAFGIVLLASSFAFAGQRTDPVAPRPSTPATSSRAQQSNTPVKKHRARKHRKAHKAQARQRSTAAPAAR
jgi:hypothetical protein